ncbi:24945_t:CDS:2, partial [Gigaspora margarita]
NSVYINAIIESKIKSIIPPKTVEKKSNINSNKEKEDYYSENFYNVNKNSNYFLKYEKELWNIDHFLDYRVICNDFSFTKSTEHLIYRNGIKKYLPGELSEQYAKAFEKDTKVDSYNNKWFAVEAFNNRKKKRQYEEMIEKLKNIHITPDIPIRQYNKANSHIFNNIK